MFKRKTAGVLLAIAIASSGISTATSGQATAVPTCTSLICMYDGSTFTGAKLTQGFGCGVVDSMPSGWNDRISSLTLNLVAYKANFFFDINRGGRKLTVLPNESFDLGSQWNNQISSYDYM